MSLAWDVGRVIRGIRFLRQTRQYDCICSHEGVQDNFELITQCNKNFTPLLLQDFGTVLQTSSHQSHHSHEGKDKWDETSRESARSDLESDSKVAKKY